MTQFCFPSIAGAVYYGVFWGFILGAFAVYGVYTVRDEMRKAHGSERRVLNKKENV